MNPGDPARPIIVTVQNAGTTVDQYTIEVENLDANWYTITAGKVALFPGDSAPVTIMIHPPKLTGIIAGRYTFEVRAVSDNRTRFGVTKGVVEIAGVVQVQGQLEPRRITGRRGNYKLTLSNAGTQETHLELSGTDAESNLEFNFKDAEPTIAPYGKVEIPVKVKPRNFNFIGQNKHYAFTISYPDFGSDPTATPPDPRNMRQVQGELIHKPILRSLRWPVIATLLGIIMFVVLIVRPDPCGPLLSWSFLCVKEPPPVPIPPPTVKAFTIIPPDPVPGERVTLSWKTKDAVVAEITELKQTIPITVTEKGDGEGELSVPVTRSSRFTLCVKNIEDVEFCHPSILVQVGSEPVPSPTAGTRPTTPPTPPGGRRASPGPGGQSGPGGAGGKGTPTRPGGQLAARTPTRPAAPGGATATPTPRLAAVTATATIAAGIVACDDQTQNSPPGSTANPPSLKVDERITLNGAGFTPGRPVQIQFFNPAGDPVRTISSGDLVAADDGTFQPRLPIDKTIFTVPGRWQVKLRDTTKDYIVTIFFCVQQ
jgi:hypothetical protein